MGQRCGSSEGSARLGESLHVTSLKFSDGRIVMDPTICSAPSTYSFCGITYRVEQQFARIQIVSNLISSSTAPHRNFANAARVLHTDSGSTQKHGGIGRETTTRAAPQEGTERRK